MDHYRDTVALIRIIPAYAAGQAQHTIPTQAGDPMIDLRGNVRGIESADDAGLSTPSDPLLAGILRRAFLHLQIIDHVAHPIDPSCELFSARFLLG
jgi:hypothetical protein